jgi:hypothetical protein
MLAGNATLAFTLPLTALGTFYLQAATFTLAPASVQASDGLQVECRR